MDQNRGQVRPRRFRGSIYRVDVIAAKQQTSWWYYCKLRNNRPNFALFLLFSGAILQNAPAQSDVREIGRPLRYSQR